MMTVKKKNKHNIERKSSLKNVFDYSYDIVTFRQKPIMLEKIDELAVELYDWAMNNEEALKLSSFFTKRGISGDTLKRWKKRSKKLKVAHELAKAAIGERRETGALSRKYESNFIYKTMPLYDKEYKVLEEWRATINRKNEQEEKTTTFNINMPNFKENDNDRSGKGD